MYRKNGEGWLKHWDFILIDLVCLQAAFLLSYWLRGLGANPYAGAVYRNMAVFTLLADIAVIFFGDMFKNVLRRGYYNEFMLVLKQASLVTLLAMMYLFVMQAGMSYSRLTLFLMGGIYAVLTYAARLIRKNMLKKCTEREGRRSLFIVTTGEAAPAVVKNLKEDNYGTFHLAGMAFLDDMEGIGMQEAAAALEKEAPGNDGKAPKQETICGVPVVCSAADAPDYVCREWVDEVFVAIPRGVGYPKKLMDQFMETGVTVHLNLARVSEIFGKKQLVEKMGGYTVLTTSLNYATAGQLFFKRLLDIAGGFVGCVLTGIIAVFVGPAIYISSPGPIFFSQERVGKNGKIFKMYKFRSMYLDAEERKQALMEENQSGDGMMFKMKFDPRVIGNKRLPDGTKKTGIGNFIRVTSLDEFPQFFNVLKGDMSLVGTRPPTLDEYKKYSRHHRARLAVKPGITGMWQASGRSEITDFEEVVKLDTEYIREWSFGLDIKILLKTVKAVLKREGSM